MTIKGLPAPSRQQTILSVFLGSPGDVVDERRRTRDVISRVNLAFRDSPVRLEYMGWEQLGPASERAQERINKLVSKCDLFIGILSGKWGSGTGVFSSGFEEEFHLAKTRNAETGSPEIWLAFKKKTAAQLADPGPDLKKILDFRREQEQTFKLLYVEYGTALDWERDLTTWLTEFMLRRARTLDLTESDSSAVSLSKSADHPVTQHQIKDRFIRLGRLAQTLPSPVGETNDKPVKADEEIQAAQMFLSASELFLTQYTDESIGTHSLNALFRHRECLDVQEHEADYLFRSFVDRQKSEVTPGWFWARGLSQAQAISRLLSIASGTYASSVREGALQLLQEVPVLLLQEQIDALPLEDDDPAIRSLAFSYLAKIGSLNDLPRFETARNDLLIHDIDDSRDLILARLAPDTLLREEMKLESYTDDLKAPVKLAIENSSFPVLNDVLLGSNAPLKYAAMKRLVECDAISVAAADRLITDPDKKIRRLAFFIKVKHGYRMAPEDFKALEDSSMLWYGALMGLGGQQTKTSDANLRFASQRHKTLAELEAAIDWYSTDGPIAYKAFAIDHWETAEHKLRSDYRDDFNEIRRQTDAQIADKEGVKVLEAVRKALGEYDESTRREFRKVALQVLLERGDTRDLALLEALDWNQSDETHEAAIELLGKYGGDSAADQITDLIFRFRGRWRTKAVGLALNLSKQQDDLLKRFLDTQDGLLTAAVYRWACVTPQRFNRKIFFHLLLSESSLDRVRAMRYYLQCSEEDKAEQLLKAYLAGGPYFYNVVVWLDRLLYAPPLFRRYYENKLTETR